MLACTQMNMVKRVVYDSSAELRNALAKHRSSGLKIGFVPTMGALHEGHLSLVKTATAHCDVVVVSIFVNPTQFNNATDLEKYPRMLESDLMLLGDQDNVLVFAPNYSEVYPEGEQFLGVDLGGLDEVMEGTFRPGHFQGVVHVVRNLFRIVEPQKAFFGLKDFQQLAIIRRMVEQLHLPVEIVSCPTHREASGLAMSSRNMLLSPTEKEQALIIPNTLFKARELRRTKSPAEVLDLSHDYFATGKLELEYMQIIDGASLQPLVDQWSDNVVMCIAAYCGPVRLIDNLELNA